MPTTGAQGQPGICRATPCNRETASKVREGYPIKRTDVTACPFVGNVERIAERYLLPLLESKNGSKRDCARKLFGVIDRAATYAD